MRARSDRLVDDQKSIQLTTGLPGDRSRARSFRRT
jgi:hypothetical protein